MFTLPYMIQMIRREEVEDEEIEALTSDEEGEKISILETPEYASMNLEDLEIELEKAISEEDYEKATILRDEIQKRK